MVAHLQRAITLGLLALTMAAAWMLWKRSPGLAFGCFGLVVSGYALFLALEFAATHFLNRHEPGPRARAGELLAAWWGETLAAPRVFCWRQPFRSKTEPDYLPNNGRRGVVLVHGFVCNRGLWTPWLMHLRTRGHAFVAVNLEPVFGSIDAYAETIEAAVQAVARDTGQAPVLVGHSMGGLAIRAWLRSQQLASAAGPNIHHIITIGTPHQGTWLGRLSHVTNGMQMRLQSPWLHALETDEQRNAPLREPQRAQGNIGQTSIQHVLSAPTTCWYSNCDNIVLPASSATLTGAENRLLRGIGHVSLAFHPDVIQHSLALLADTPLT